MRNLIILLSILVVLTSCNSSSETSNESPEIIPRGLLKNGDSISIDTNVILENKNLDRLISLIEEQKLQTDTTKEKIPQVVISFLKNISVDSFSLADPNQNWQVGCTVIGFLPKRQLNYLGQSKNMTIMTYYKGGWGKSGHIIIIEHDNKNVLDFWKGNGFDLNNKDTIIKYLRQNNELHSGLLDI
jgi:hypothetical protein